LKNKHAVALGKVGGKTKGDAKKRSNAHYKRISILGHLKRGHKVKEKQP
jgi:hypothetical protein